METEKKRSSWTEWAEIGKGAMPGAEYKTNSKKVKVRFLPNNIVAESCCCKDDTFNLTFGIRLAFLRCLVKAWEKSKGKCEDANDMKKIDEVIAGIKTNIKEMIDSLDN